MQSVLTPFNKSILLLSRYCQKVYTSIEKAGVHFSPDTEYWFTFKKQLLAFPKHKKICIFFYFFYKIVFFELNVFCEKMFLWDIFNEN